MRTLFRRELRRQAPVAVASLALGLFVTILWLVVSESGTGRIDGAWVGFAVTVVTSAYLLGVASVAPDAESGAQAFLATLPMGHAREMLVRWSAALLLATGTAALACLGPAWILHDVVMRPDAHFNVAVGGEIAAILPAGIVALAAGLLGSVAVRRTLVAFVTAPLFVGAIAVAFEWFHTWMHAPYVFERTAGWALVPVILFAAAAAHLRGDVHRPSLRPLGVASIVLGAALVLGFGSITAGRALAWSTERWILDSFPATTSRDGRRLAVNESRTSWSVREERGALVSLDSGAIERTFGRGRHAIAVDPAGETAVVLDDADNWFRVEDLATGALLSRQLRRPLNPLESPGAVSARATSLVVTTPTYREETVVWRGRTPYFVCPDGRLWGGEGKVLALPADARAIESHGGSRLILRRPDASRLLWDLGRREADPAVVSDLAPATAIDAALSPDGRIAVLLVPSGDGFELRWADLDAPARVWKTFPVTGVLERVVETTGEPLPPTIVVAFSPSSSKAFIAWEKTSRPAGVALDSESVIVDLATNTGHTLDLPGSDRLLAPTSWSPSEKKVVIGFYRVVDLSARPGPVRDMPALTVGFMDEEHVLTSAVGGAEVLDIASLEKANFEPKAREHTRR
jgi:hypothetical protein